MDDMFKYCYVLPGVDLSNFNTSKVKTMEYMFGDCYGLLSVDLSTFKTDSLERMSYMFNNCYSLTSVDLSGFNTSKVTLMHEVFRDCGELVTITVGDEWTTEAVNTRIYSPYNVFNCCYKLVGGQGTVFNPRYATIDYAHIDGGPENPGYLTRKAYPGDVDGDKVVSISDVTALVDYLLSGDTTAINVANADVDQDGQVGISDVTALVDMLLSNN